MHSVYQYRLDWNLGPLTLLDSMKAKSSALTIYSATSMGLETVSQMADLTEQTISMAQRTVTQMVSKKDPVKVYSKATRSGSESE
jgi:hypothetical protein